MDDMQKVRAVQRMQLHIEKHLHEKISLKNLADVAGYSPWHADRIFKELTGRLLAARQLDQTWHIKIRTRS